MFNKRAIPARETPLTLVHLRNMVTVTEMGGVVFPPVPAFYAKLDSLEVAGTFALDLDVGGQKQTKQSSGR